MLKSYWRDLVLYSSLQCFFAYLSYSHLYYITTEKLKIGKYVKFNKWIEMLQVAHIPVGNKTNKRTKRDDPHLLFASVLNEAVQQFADLRENPLLPINIFPLSFYQSALEGYTDKQRNDVVAALRKITIYKNFAKLLGRKYESLYL